MTQCLIILCLTLGCCCLVLISSETIHPNKTDRDISGAYFESTVLDAYIIHLLQRLNVSESSETKHIVSFTITMRHNLCPEAWWPHIMGAHIDRVTFHYSSIKMILIHLQSVLSKDLTLYLTLIRCEHSSLHVQTQFSAVELARNAALKSFP